jgi:predicted lipid carrier protein YhbT
MTADSGVTLAMQPGAGFKGAPILSMQDRSEAAVPPLTPALLLGIALAPLPVALLQPALDRSMAAMVRRHPATFRRLAALEGRAFRIEPTDLPFAFRLAPSAQPPCLTVLQRGDPGDPTAATLRAPIATLLALLEGRLDGDALFFARDLAVEGDTEAILTLRNAVDGAEIRLAEDLTAALGPLAPPARRMAEAGLRWAGRASDDLRRLQSALLAPLAREVAALSRRVERMAEQTQPPPRTRAERPRPDRTASTVEERSA